MNSTQTTKVAINGFGRIGRLVARIILHSNHPIEIVAVNDLTDAQSLAYLLEFDSTYRHLGFEVTADDTHLYVKKGDTTHTIAVYASKDPAQIPWRDHNVDVVLECTGRFLTQEKAQGHITAGAKKVIMSAPSKDDTPMVVLGVNEVDAGSQFISNASCTTNCISPALHALLQGGVEIESVVGMTVHAYTATQALKDSVSNKFRKGRAAAVNMIPTSTGAATAVERVIPELQGKLQLTALRVPVITGSMVYTTVTTKLEYSATEINEILYTQSKRIPEILHVSDKELVSSDIIQNPHSCIVDSKLTKTVGNTAILTLWYDNEWGYANRLVDLIELV